MIIGPDGALYFCDLDNQRIRRFDLRTRRTTDVAGNGERGYRGDGGPATAAIAEHAARDRVRRAAVISTSPSATITSCGRSTPARGVISTLAGTGVAGFSGDGGPATRAQLRQPHSIALGPDGRLLICDVGNHRIRAVNLSSGTIETIGGTG